MKRTFELKPFSSSRTFLFSIVESTKTDAGFANMDGRFSRLQRVGRLDPVQLETAGPFTARQRFDSFPGGEISGPLVPIGDDQRLMMA